MNDGTGFEMTRANDKRGTWRTSAYLKTFRRNKHHTTTPWSPPRTTTMIWNHLVWLHLLPSIPSRYFCIISPANSPYTFLRKTDLKDNGKVEEWELIRKMILWNAVSDKENYQQLVTILWIPHFCEKKQTTFHTLFEKILRIRFSQVFRKHRRISTNITRIADKKKVLYQGPLVIQQHHTKSNSLKYPLFPSLPSLSHSPLHFEVSTSQNKTQATILQTSLTLWRVSTERIFSRKSNRTKYSHVEKVRKIKGLGKEIFAPLSTQLSVISPIRNLTNLGWFCDEDSWRSEQQGVG